MMKDLIISHASLLIGTSINQPILTIATDYVISIALGYLNASALSSSLVPLIAKAVASEYANMILEDKNIKAYSAGDIALHFSDPNLTQHLSLLEKDLLPYRKLKW